MGNRNRLLLGTALSLVFVLPGYGQSFYPPPGLTAGGPVDTSTVTLPSAPNPLPLTQSFVDARGLNIRAYHSVGDGADYSPALSLAYQTMNTNYLVGGLYTPVYIPPGANWTLNTPLTTLPAASVPAALVGNGLRHSWLTLGVNFTGPVYRCSQTPLVFTTPTILPTATSSGCRVQDLSITGNTTSSGQQGLMFYDAVDGALVSNVSIYDLPGPCLSAGTVLNKTNAFFRESLIDGLTCYNTGSAGTIPTLYVSSTGTQDASNQDLIRHFRSFSSAADGVVVENANLTSPVRQITFLDAKVENSAGNNFRIGSSSLTGSITTIDCISCAGISPSSGNSNLLVTAVGTASAVANSSFTDFLSLAGAGTGGGVNIQYGKNLTVSMVANTTTGTQVTVGCGINGPLTITGQGDESTYTTSVCGSLTAGLLRFGSAATISPKTGFVPTAAFGVPGTSSISTTGTAHTAMLGGGISLVSESATINVVSVGTATGNLSIGLPAGATANQEFASCIPSQVVSSTGSLPGTPSNGTGIQVAAGSGLATPIALKTTGLFTTWTAANTAVGTYTINFSCVIF
jgi:hypothetical protein